MYHFFQSNFGLLAKIIYCFSSILLAFFLTFLLICNIHIENCFAVYIQKHIGIYRNQHSSKNFHSEHTQKVPSCLFHLLSSSPKENHYPDFYYHRLVLSILIFYINKLTLYELFFLWFLWLNIMFVIFVHVIARRINNSIQCNVVKSLKFKWYIVYNSYSKYVSITS